MPTASTSARRPRPARALLIVAALLTMALLVAGAAWFVQHGRAAGRPNVILIVTDDQRFDAMWVMPTMNELAGRGITFDRFFVTTPLCCPSRASIMTGLYARHHGVLTNQPPLGSVEKFDDRSTLATWIHAAGVRTGLVGRYLNGYASTYVPPGWDAWFALWQTANYFDYHATENGVRRSYGSSPQNYSSRVLRQKALDFLDAERERPFLLMLTTRAPHSPATPDPEDAGKFRRLDLPIPPSYDEEDVGDKPSWVQALDRFNADDRKALESSRRARLESMLGVDRAIAAMVEKLRADGRLENTWILFTSDNGVTIGEHRLPIGKACPYEECVRVPFVVVPPAGRYPARTDSHLVANIDLAPTVADILGVTPEQPTDGRSLLPLLADPNIPWRDALVLEAWKDLPIAGSEVSDSSFFSIRTADRKYVRYDNREEELYDLDADPYELTSLHLDPTRADEKARLAAALDALLARPPGVDQPQAGASR